MYTISEAMLLVKDALTSLLTYTPPIIASVICQGEQHKTVVFPVMFTTFKS